jgi:hypothetical protein
MPVQPRPPTTIVHVRLRPDELLLLDALAGDRTRSEIIRDGLRALAAARPS